MVLPALTADALREAFAALARGQRRIALHLHLPDQHASFVEPALQILRGVLEESGPITVDLQPTAFLYDGVAVYAELPGEPGLCGRPYRHGVRTFTFRRGLGIPDLLALCRVAQPRPAGDPGPGREDVVTELWKGDLTGLGYSTVEGYGLEQAGLDAEAASSLVGEVARRARAALEVRPLHRSAFAEEDALGGAPLLERKELELLDPRLWGDLAERTARALLRIVEQGFAGRDLDALEEALWRLIDELLDHREPTVLARLLEALRRLGGPHAPDFRERIGQRLGEGRRLLRVVELSGLSDRALKQVLPQWLPLLPRDAGPVLIELVGQAPAQAQAQIARAAIDRADSSLDLLAEVLAQGAPGTALALLGALDGLSPATRAELAVPALDHPVARVRIEAISAVGGEPDVAVGMLGRLLEAPEGSVRSAAALVLSGCAGQPEKAAQLLIDAIESDSFLERDAEEQAGFHRALGKLGSNLGFQFLSNRLTESRGLFRKRPAEAERLLAVAGLAAEPSLRAVRALESAAAPGTDQPPTVATAARTALQRAARLPQRGRSA